MSDLPPLLSSQPGGTGTPGTPAATGPTPPIVGQSTPLGLLWNGSAWEPVQKPLTGFASAPAEHSITEAMLTEAVQLKLNPTGWQAVALGPKLEASLAELYLPAAVRMEDGPSVIRFRGAVTVKAAEEVNVGNTIFTMPVGFRVPHELSVALPMIAGVAATTMVAVKIKVNGEVTAQVAIASGNRLVLEGFTLPLT